ncbi:hypothetical protein BCR39DRAFT_509803 [Naematelia encephala]|uniref:Uncharacterized protein n=1 Tax=Naematelia encephala TaxID=71784 RepID=A0A1Y2BL02_9TREE|nr:hypothetical protein BCR39DRAFT_509803 [Naematelia encephala]
MEFLSHTTVTPPKNIFPCLATISIHPPATDSKGRRLSTGGSDDEGNALTRVISGGNRRRTSFGPTADWNGDSERRKSTEEAKKRAPGEEGRWYWRVQAGVTNSQLVLLPLSQPPNPLLTSPPAPLSQAMPSHSTVPARSQPTTAPNDSAIADDAKEGKEGFGDKIKHFLHIGSNASHPSHPETKETTSTASTDATAVDAITDQNAQGQQLTPAAGAADAHAETNWPGIVYGEKLGAIVVDLRAVDKTKVTVGTSKKLGTTVLVPIGSTGAIEPLGREAPKTGTIKFEFDKEWIGAKGEAELLHFYITSGIDASAGAVAKPAPQSTTYQIGSHSQTIAGNAPLGQEIAPDSQA